ncbi:MAG: Ca-activated chloride channel [Acidimicrobiia bacterium]|nr:Ca-activated chloride channel [Acidimicrobiia bacterium]
MTFLSPAWLLLLLSVVALGVIYVLAQRRRRSYAVRFTNLELLDVVAPERPGWRRHLPAIALLVGMVALIGALARPARDVRVPKERATIMVALDTSLSMMANDVTPNRVEAAKAAAKSFVDLLPAKLNVGLVTFNRSVQVRVAPTLDHASVKDAIGALQLGEGTAIGDAIIASVGAIKEMPQVVDGEHVPARIVLMSDGQTTVGKPDSAGVQAANAAEIPVSTIAFGTDGGVVNLGDRTPIPVPVDRAALKQIADQTGGVAFSAASSAELKKVYADIGSAIGYNTEQREISRWFIGFGLLALLAAAGMSLLWFSRLP